MSGQLVITWLAICLMCSVVTGILCWYAAVDKMARKELDRRRNNVRDLFAMVHEQREMEEWRARSPMFRLLHGAGSQAAPYQDPKPRDFKIVRDK